MKDWQKKLSDDFDVDGYTLPQAGAEDFYAKFRAAELRGRASGMREAAEMFRNDWLNDTDRFYDAAEAFEKIKAAASKLSPT